MTLTPLLLCKFASELYVCLVQMQGYFLTYRWKNSFCPTQNLINSVYSYISSQVYWFSNCPDKGHQNNWRTRYTDQQSRSD